MPDVISKPAPIQTNISALIPLEDGNFGIFIDDKLFGEISAHPSASFVVYDKEPVGNEKKKGRALPAGTHSVEWRGHKLNVVVKDLQLRPLPEYEHFSNQEKSDSEFMIRIRKEYPDLMDHRKLHAKHNEEVRKEVLNRVVVTKA